MPKYTRPAALLGASLQALLCPAPAGAQIFVEPASTVGASALQLESGLVHSRDGALRSWITPSLVSLGIGNALELRAESDLWVRESSRGEAEEGIADLSVGFKWAATESRSGRPGLAFLVNALLPTGSRQRRGDGLRPSLRGSVEWKLPAGARLTVMPGVERSTGVDGAETTGLLGVALGKGWGNRFSAFMEVALEQLSGGNGSTASWTAGSTYLLGEGTQLDAGFSLPTTSYSPGFTVLFSQLFRW